MNVICYVCNREIDENNQYAFLQRKDNFVLCHRCYRREVQPKRICSGCHLEKVIVRRSDQLCISCYNKTREIKIEICLVCKNEGQVYLRLEDGYSICKKCYIPPEKECDVCHEIKQIAKKDNNINYCENCYLKNFKQKCSKCNKIKRISVNKNGEKICINCMRKERRLYDERYRLMGNLRHRMKEAIKKQINNKSHFVEKCGVDIDEIINSLGPCPGNREDYHIDHYFPLSIFDLTEPKQVIAAFAPENHRWLTKEENLKKNNRYDKEEFKEYLKKYDIILEQEGDN